MLNIGGVKPEILITYGPLTVLSAHEFKYPINWEVGGPRVYV
jgi:hypothetical protein